MRSTLTPFVHCWILFAYICTLLPSILSVSGRGEASKSPLLGSKQQVNALSLEWNGSQTECSTTAKSPRIY